MFKYPPVSTQEVIVRTEGPAKQFVKPQKRSPSVENSPFLSRSALDFICCTKLSRCSGWRSAVTIPPEIRNNTWRRVATTTRARPEKGLKKGELQVPRVSGRRYADKHSTSQGGQSSRA